MSITRRDLEAYTLQRDRAVAPALDSFDLSGKGLAQGFRRWTGSRQVRGGEETAFGALACLPVDLVVILAVDPYLGRLVELLQRQVCAAFEHGQQPTLDLPPQHLLLPVLIVMWRAT